MQNINGYDDDREKVYTISLNSVNGLPHTTNDTINYAFDWNVLPKGRYEVSFSFLSESNAYWGSGPFPQLFVDLGQNNSFTTGSSTGATPTKFIGLLRPETNLGPAVNYTAVYTDNPPFLIESLPRNNIITVQIFNRNSTIWRDDSASTGYSGAMAANSRVLTITGARTSGFPLRPGQFITMGAKSFIIESIISNTGGGLGTYTTTLANDAVAITATAITASSSAMAEYMLTLRFKQVK